MQSHLIDKAFTRRKFGALAAMATALAVMAGCTSTGGGMPGGSGEARTVTVNLTASSDVNPGPDGGAAPLPIQLYVLRSSGTFQALDYFGLKGGLSADQVDSRSLSLRPGESTIVTMNAGTDGAYVGVAAGYRSIESARWRSVASIGSGSSFTVRAGRSSVSISAR